ncbi:MAG: hypothetical protein M1598_03530, partial [Actinobacteria bacterium]|nr:hypothetical protein [Actinomycetota bacterium]
QSPTWLFHKPSVFPLAHCSVFKDQAPFGSPLRGGDRVAAFRDRRVWRVTVLNLNRIVFACQLLVSGFFGPGYMFSPRRKCYFITFRPALQELFSGSGGRDGLAACRLIYHELHAAVK